MLSIVPIQISERFSHSVSAAARLARRWRSPPAMPIRRCSSSGPGVCCRFGAPRANARPRLGEPSMTWIVTSSPPLQERRSPPRQENCVRGRKAPLIPPWGWAPRVPKREAWLLVWTLTTPASSRSSPPPPHATTTLSLSRNRARFVCTLVPPTPGVRLGLHLHHHLA